MPPTIARTARTAIGAVSSGGTACAAASRGPMNSPSQKRPMYASVSAAASTAMSATAQPASRAAAKNSSSLKNPRVSGSAASVAAAPPRATATPGSSCARPPSRDSRVSPVATVTAPAVMNSALLAIACAITYSAAAPAPLAPPMPYSATTYPYWEIVEWARICLSSSCASASRPPTAIDTRPTTSRPSRTMSSSASSGCTRPITSTPAATIAAECR